MILINSREQILQGSPPPRGLNEQPHITEKAKRKETKKETSKGITISDAELGYIHNRFIAQSDLTG